MVLPCLPPHPETLKPRNRVGDSNSPNVAIKAQDTSGAISRICRLQPSTGVPWSVVPSALSNDVLAHERVSPVITQCKAILRFIRSWWLL
eukprot:367866-Pyramimonas_sp.AAC.2